jgi:hypothetical protein
LHTEAVRLVEGREAVIVLRELGRPIGLPCSPGFLADGLLPL